MAQKKQVAAAATTSDSGPLTAAEVAAWDERLGADTEYVSQWGRLVSNFLFGLPAERRVAHLAHALKFYPFVPETPGGRFAEKQMTDDEWRRRVAFIDSEPNISRVMDAIKGSQPTTEEAAAMLLAVLAPLDADVRAVFFGLMIRRWSVLRFVGVPKPRKTSILDNGDVRTIVVSHREVVLPALVALGHINCDHTSPTDVGGIVLDVLNQVVPKDRPVVLGFLLSQLAGTQEGGHSHEGPNPPIPPQLAELFARGGAKLVGVAVGRLVGVQPPDAPADAPAPDKKDLN